MIVQQQERIEHLLHPAGNIAHRVGKLISENRALKPVYNIYSEAYNLLSKELMQLTPDIKVFPRLSNPDETFWAVNAFDGKGIYKWGISVALVKNKETQLAIAFLPKKNRFIAVSKRSSPSKYLYVNNNRNISKASIWMKHAVNATQSIEMFNKLSRATSNLQEKDSATYSLLAVAGGEISGYVCMDPKLEDIAAGCLIIEKAGGRVTDLHGKTWTPFSKSIVATNGLLHDQLLSALNS